MSVFNEGDVRLRKEKETEYDRFLRQRQKTIPPALWRFFASDCFHDGAIERVDHSPNFRSVTLSIWCSNIKSVKGDDYDFVNALFHVHLGDVSRFAVDFEPESGTSVSDNRDLTYSSCEIDTIVDPEPANEDRDHSLIIDAGDRWLTIVFGSVRVDAAEPMAFELMRSDPRFKFPWAQQNQS